MSGSRDIHNITLDGLLRVGFKEVDANLRKQLKAFGTKENKQAFLEEYSQDPWRVIEPSHTAFDYLLRLGRVTGKLCNETKSSREYAYLRGAKNSLVEQAKAFLQEAVFPLDRSVENPYYTRAMQYKQASRPLRAIFDFQVAHEIFQQQQQHVQAQHCAREMMVCYYQAGMDFNAYIALQEARENNLPQQPMGKVAGALALVRYHSQHLIRPQFNPLQVLCEALAGSQADEVVNPIVAFLKSEKALVTLVDRYCPHDYGLMIDLFELLPKAASDDVIGVLLANQQSTISDPSMINNDGVPLPLGRKVIELFKDMKVIAGIPFSEMDCTLDQERGTLGICSRLQLPPASQAEAYPSSAIIVYNHAWSEIKEGEDNSNVGYLLQKSLSINPAYFPARLLALALNPKPFNELVPAFREMFVQHPQVVEPYALAYEKAAAGDLTNEAAKALAFEFAGLFVASYEQAKRNHQDTRAIEVVYNKAKADLVVCATHRQDYLKNFLACDPEDKRNYLRACDAIKKKFSKADAQFNDFVRGLLGKEDRGNGCLFQAIRLCAANDKRTDVNNLLLKNNRARQILKEGDDGGAGNVMKYFSDKMKDFIHDYFNPAPSALSFMKKRPLPAPVSMEVSESQNNELTEQSQLLQPH